MTAMPMIELHFPVLGSTLPTDHAYALYAALSERIPALHDAGIPWRVAGIAGHFAGQGLLQLEPGRSRLRFRLPAENIPVLLPLAGKALEIAGHRVRLGVPQVRPLIPAPGLLARVVTIKGFLEPALFLEAVRRQLDALNIQGEPGIPLTKTGKRKGLPHRHVLRIKDKQVVGFAVQVMALTAEESIRLQEAGIGGRGHLGCGFFVPVGLRQP
jgi:CRISPR-associated endonuclease/helicase Cas3